MLDRAAPAAYPTLEEVLQPIPRRARLITPTDREVRPLSIPKVTFHAGVWDSAKRLMFWFSVIAHMLSGRLRDKLAGKDTIARRARRLREALDRVGGTFVKFGQQIAMRIDVVPWEYCVELSKMLDRMRPFPTEQALAAVERAAGRPWHEVFAVFDPEAVGSASIACVYQAVLKDGTKVAVKVRRPGIGDVFMADFRVMDWLFGLIEWLTIVRPGFSSNLRKEFRDTLLEELDFRKEAHFQHVFRRNAGRTKGNEFFTAPVVRFELSNDEVLVQEFVSGMWLWEVIATIEQRDPEGYKLMKQLNIDPALVARRILRVAFWSQEENLFFHADPHPANIVVGPDSTLTLIDFGSCGSFNNDQRWAIQRLVLSMLSNDAEGMARATMKLIEPLPPLDVSAVMKEAQAEYMRVLYTFRTKAKHTEWWERTSARQWMALVKLARQFNLPLNLHTLRMIRATLLYDTLALRLDATIDRYEEYSKFTRARGKLARKRWRKRMRDARHQLVAHLTEARETGSGVLERAHDWVASPVAGFTSLIDKSVFAFSVLTRMTGRLLALTAAASAAVGSVRYVRTGTVPVVDTLSTVLQNHIFQFVAVIVIALNLRHILLRFRERDVVKKSR